MNILEAVDEVKIELEAGTTPTEALVYVAEVSGFKEEVLEHRFKIAHGVSTKDYSPVTLTRSMEDICQEEIAKQTKNYSFSADGAKLVGKKFFCSGEFWYFIAFTGSKIHSVRAQSGKAWQHSGRNHITKILNQVQG